MSGRDDLAATREAIMARKREELGEVPAPEELLAWRDRRLDPAAGARLEAKIAVNPDAARALADLAAFPDVQPAPGTPVLSDDDVEAGWAALLQRLEEIPRPAPVLRPRSVRSTWSPIWQAAAAILLLSVGLGTGYLAGRASRAPAPETHPARNVQIAELEPVAQEGEGGFRAPAEPVELPEGSEGLVLVLDLPGTETFSGYAVEVFDREGTPLWSGDGLHPTPLGTIQLSFPRSAFAPGVYRIDLLGVDGAGRTTRVARYGLRVALAPGPS